MKRGSKTLELPKWVLGRFYNAIQSKKGHLYTGKQIVKAASDLLDELQVQRDFEEKAASKVSFEESYRSGVRGILSKKSFAYTAAHVSLRAPATFATAFHALNEGFGLQHKMGSHGGEAGGVKVTDRDVRYEVKGSQNSLEQARDRGPKTVINVLDFGAGMGTSSLALKSVLPDLFGLGEEDVQHKMKVNLHAVEENVALRRVGSEIVPEAIWYSHLGPTREDYDVVLAGYALQDLPRQVQVNGILNRVWNKLKPGGVFIIIESGTPTGSSVIQHARKHLLQGFEDVKILAPCTHHFQCPMLDYKKQWCHFPQKYIKSDMQSTLLRSNPSNRTKVAQDKWPWKNSKRQMVEKFSYIALGKSAAQGLERTSIMMEQIAKRGVTARISQQERAECSPYTPPEHARIVATPQKRGGHILFKICGNECSDVKCEKGGRKHEQGIAARAEIRKVVVTKSDSEYVNLKPKKWGDLFENVDSPPAFHD